MNGDRISFLEPSLTTLPRVDVTRAQLAQVHLYELMKHTRGVPHVAIGVIDGAVDAAHPLLEAPVLNPRMAYARPTEHGTFVAGVLGARRDSGAPGICPSCTLISRPIFEDDGGQPRTTLREVARAILDCIEAGAHVINLSVEAKVGRGDAASLREALDVASAHEVAIVTAAGNGGALEGSPLTDHPWVIPVVACEGDGTPLATSTLNRSIGLRGLSAPGRDVTSLALDGLARMSGASVGAPFVTGAYALLRTLFPNAASAEIVRALRSSGSHRTIVPPQMNAAVAWRRLQQEGSR